MYNIKYMVITAYNNPRKMKLKKTKNNTDIFSGKPIESKLMSEIGKRIHVASKTISIIEIKELEELEGLEGF